MTWITYASEGHGEYFLHEWYVDTQDSMPVAVVDGEANARLIVAAPHTMTVLVETKETVCLFTCGPFPNPGHSARCQRITAAIAKAKA